MMVFFNPAKFSDPRFVEKPLPPSAPELAAVSYRAMNVTALCAHYISDRAMSPVTSRVWISSTAWNMPAALAAT
jgi:hypothetical protein